MLNIVNLCAYSEICANITKFCELFWVFLNICGNCEFFWIFGSLSAKRGKFPNICNIHTVFSRVQVTSSISNEKRTLHKCSLFRKKWCYWHLFAHCVWEFVRACFIFSQYRRLSNQFRVTFNVFFFFFFRLHYSEFHTLWHFIFTHFE